MGHLESMSEKAHFYPKPTDLARKNNSIILHGLTRDELSNMFIFYLACFKSDMINGELFYYENYLNNFGFFIYILIV